MLPDNIKYFKKSHMPLNQDLWKNGILNSIRKKMESSFLITILIIFLMLLINSIFAAYEIALASTSLGKLKILAEQNKKGSHAALSMKNRMEASLAVVQIGITLAGAIAAATGGASAEEKLSPYFQNMLNVSESFSEFIAITFIVIPLTAVTIIFGELVPKTLAIKNSEKVCLYLSPFMKFFSYIVYPSVLFFEWITKSIVKLFEKHSSIDLSEGNLGLIELKAYANALKTNSIINKDQEKIIIGAGNLSNTTVEDIMIPAYDIVTLFADADLPDHFIKIHLDPYSRFPVTEKDSDPQFIVGYVNIKELIFLSKTHPENPNVREIIRPLLTFQSSSTIGEAFSRMMKDHVHLALVKDAKDNDLIKGMITIEDILEEVVGDIQDEFDRLPKHITQLGKKYIVGGGVLINNLFENILHLNLTEDFPDDMTFSEWVKNNYHKQIKGGEVIHIASVTVTVRKVKLNHIFEAAVSV